jgi:hypothetical protein
MKKHIDDNRSGPPIEPLAEALVAAWSSTLGTRPADRSQCLTIRQVEDYVADRTALVVGDRLLPHVTACESCRRRLMALVLMETGTDERRMWRLPHIRAMVGEGSQRAVQVASSVRSWLEHLTADPSSADDPQPLLAVAEGGESAVGRILAAAIDARGRLVVQAQVAVPVGERAEAAFSLEQGGARLDLFTSVLRNAHLEAVVDMSCCAPGPVRLRKDALRMRVAEKIWSPEPVPDLTLKLEMSMPVRPVDLAAVDQLLAMASIDELAAELSATRDSARTAAAFSGAADLLARYIRMWSVGNQGEIPEAAVDLLAALACRAYAEAPSDAFTSVKYPEKLSTSISQVVKPKDMQIDA